MKSSSRSAVAFIIMQMNSINPLEHIRDTDNDVLYRFVGDVSPTKVNIFDNQEDCYISGNVDTGKVKVYHFGQECEISFEITINSFRGYDHGCGEHFQGRVKEDCVWIYDFEEKTYFNYST